MCNRDEDISEAVEEYNACVTALKESVDLAKGLLWDIDIECQDLTEAWADLARRGIDAPVNIADVITLRRAVQAVLEIIEE